MKRFKIALALIAGFLLLVVILQNTDTVETRILSATIALPRAVLLFLAVLFGFVLGYAAALWRRVRHRQDAQSSAAGAAGETASPKKG
ncbi:MAG: lipopolysaccharide assembly protein LapA domain-containing protein [Planctomycetota bacterium]|jgi:uncharacterized integral membrane protein